MGGGSGVFGVIHGVKEVVEVTKWTGFFLKVFLDRWRKVKKKERQYNIATCISKTIYSTSATEYLPTLD